MQISNNIIKDVISNISDPKLRELYGQIINDSITHQVKCTSRVCRERVVGYIFANGVVKDNLLLDAVGSPKLDKKTGLPVSGIRSSRQRFDGQRGFQCWCGNNSILAQEEKGVITSSVPTKSDFEKIANRLMSRGKLKIPKINGKTDIDGFIVEEVK